MPWNTSEEHDHAGQLYQLIERLRADDEWSRRVGEAGQAMFREHLTREAVLLYWRTLITGAGSRRAGACMAVVLQRCQPAHGHCWPRATCMP